MTDDVERAPRKSIFLAALIEAGSLKAQVRIRNMSEGGAMIEGAALPATNSSFVLRRAEIEIGGVVVWSQPGRCGAKFDGVANVDEWIAGKRLPERVNILSGQRRVDGIQSAIRLGQPLDSFCDHDEFLSAPSELPGRDALQGRVGEEIAAVHRLLVKVADDLSDDPLILARHSSQLQSLQGMLEVLSHLARVLQALDPEGEAENITLRALRARLLKRPIF